MAACCTVGPPPPSIILSSSKAAVPSESGALHTSGCMRTGDGGTTTAAVSYYSPPARTLFLLACLRTGTGEAIYICSVQYARHVRFEPVSEHETNLRKLEASIHSIMAISSLDTQSFLHRRSHQLHPLLPHQLPRFLLWTASLHLLISHN